MSKQRLALIGCGAIGRALLQQMADDRHLTVTQIIVHGRGLDAARRECAVLAPLARLLTQLDLDSDDAPQLVVECAGHAAVEAHVLPALRRGVPVVLASIGSLHDAQLLASLADAAAQGNTQVHLVAGAVGGIDALAAAKLGGLERVHYIGRKPPHSWIGTPAEALHDLAALQSPVSIFEGSAREAARLYPKNANVAATVSLAGLGFDATQATLVADPAVARNVHRIVAEGAFGRLDLTMENNPLAANPKTSALTVYSLLRAIHNASDAIAL